MDDRARNRTIGLIVLIIIIIGPALFLTNFFGNTGSAAHNSKTRKITVDVGKNQSETGKKENSASSKTSGSHSKKASKNKNGTFQTPPVKTQVTSANHSGKTPPQSKPSHQAAGVAGGVHSSSSPSNSAPSSENTARAATSNAANPSNTNIVNKPRSQGGNGKWAVQVASFKTRKKAKQLISKLSGQYNSFYAAGEVNGTNYFRVRVGPFKTRNQAEKIKKQLEASGYKPYITHR